MGGRDPEEQHRTSTPLELLYDLTFVIAYGTAANELAHALSQGHVEVALVGFGFAAFAVTWAWIQWSWFASAYDTDDWSYRLNTLVQMGGVLVLAVGLGDMFASIEHGEHLDNRVMVLGYVIMRVPMLIAWLRASRQDPGRRRIHLVYVTSIVVSQALWCVIGFATMPVGVSFAAMVVPILVELSGPRIAESLHGGTPWHPHHIAERYGLLVIVALGEGLLGTVASINAIVGPGGPGWSWPVVVLGVSGVSLTFGCWWIYFVVPSGEILELARSRAYWWAYLHFFVFPSVVAIGAGLHVAAYWFEHHSALGEVATVVSVVVPVACYLVSVFVVYGLLTRRREPFHVLLLALSAVVLAAAVLLARLGLPLEWCVAVAATTPWITVVGYEAIGHRHNEAVLAGLRA